MPANLQITHISVKRDRIVSMVVLGPDVPRMTDARLAARLLEDFPTLARHVCANGKGPHLTDVLAETSIPHVLEHLAVDFQAKTDPDGMFIGTTEWLDRQAGIARVSLNFRNDLVALGSLKKAAAYINDLLTSIR